jgi:hypothetical protein
MCSFSENWAASVQISTHEFPVSSRDVTNLTPPWQEKFSCDVIIPAQGEFSRDIPAGDGKLANLFFTVHACVCERFKYSQDWSSFHIKRSQTQTHEYLFRIFGNGSLQCSTVLAYTRFWLVSIKTTFQDGFDLGTIISGWFWSMQFLFPVCFGLYPFFSSCWIKLYTSSS